MTGDADYGSGLYRRGRDSVRIAAYTAVLAMMIHIATPKEVFSETGAMFVVELVAGLASLVLLVFVIASASSFIVERFLIPESRKDGGSDE